MTITVDDEKCIVCCDCINQCPTSSLGIRSGKIIHYQEDCQFCEQCVDVCNNNVLDVNYE